jgi:hypothetical protein
LVIHEKKYYVELTGPGTAAEAPPVMRTRVVGIHLKMVAVLFHLPWTQYMPAETWQQQKPFHFHLDHSFSFGFSSASLCYGTESKVKIYKSLKISWSYTIYSILFMFNILHTVDQNNTIITCKHGMWMWIRIGS